MVTSNLVPAPLQPRGRCPWGRGSPGEPDLQGAPAPLLPGPGRVQQGESLPQTHGAGERAEHQVKRGACSPRLPAGSEAPARPLGSGWGSGRSARELCSPARPCAHGNTVGSLVACSRRDLLRVSLEPGRGVRGRAGEAEAAPLLQEPESFSSSQQLFPPREQLELPGDCALRRAAGCGRPGVSASLLPRPLLRCKPSDPLTYLMGKLSQQNILRL